MKMSLPGPTLAHGMVENQNGEIVSSGHYVVLMEVDGKNITEKIVVLK